MPKITTMMASVQRALLTRGSRNPSTQLLTASTPVIAVQPLANARNNSHRLSASTALGGGGGGTTGCGWPPLVMTA